jgi:hypothetical protein
MVLIDAIKSLASKMSSSVKANDADNLVSIKGYYADRALMCNDEDGTDFLRLLNRCETFQDLWSIRAGFYTLLARNFGEVEAMRNTKEIEAMFEPYLKRGEIRGADTRHGKSRQRFETTLDRGRGMNTNSFSDSK